MKRTVLLLVVLLATSLLFAEGERDRRLIVIRKGFINQTTYEIVCKGYPKEGTEGLSRTQTAKEAALMNAQFIVRDLFTRPVDPVRDGTARKFDTFPDYAVVYYEISRENLRRYVKARLKKRGR